MKKTARGSPGLLSSAEFCFVRQPGLLSCVPSGWW